MRGRRFVGLALVALVLACGERSARAETPSDWAVKLSLALRQADYQKIFMALRQLSDKEFVEQLVDDPKACYVAMRGLAGAVGKFASEEDEFAKGLIDTVVAVGKGLKEKHPDDPYTSRALGALNASKAHFAWTAGKDFEFDDWEQALSLTAKSYATGAPVAADDADGAADGCLWMREVYRHPKFKGDPTMLSSLESTAQVLADLATQCAGDGAHAEVVRAQGRFLAAQRAYRSGGSAKASPALAALFAALAPLAKPDGDAVLVGLWNDAVTFAKSWKIPTSADYVFPSQVRTAGSLTYRIPAGSRWHAESSDGDRVLGSFYAFDTMGRQVRSVTIREYRWDYNYVISEKEKTGGDNAKGLAKMLLKDHKTDFSTFKEIPLQRSTFAKKLPPGQVFELVGVDGNANYKRVRGIFVKGKEAQVTYGITIRDLEDFGKTDAEVEAILDTFVETKSK